MPAVKTCTYIWACKTGPGMCSVLSCCTGLASERMECNCERSQQIAEVLFLFVFVYNKCLLYPLAFRMKKQPAIPARCAGPAPKGLLHYAGSAHLYGYVNTSALYLTGVPTKPATLSMLVQHPASSWSIPTQAAIPHFSRLEDHSIDKSVLACPHFFVFFRAFKMVYDYWYFSH